MPAASDAAFADLDASANARRERQRRLHALGAVARPQLRIAACCALAADVLLIAQAALIAWSMQRAFVERVAPGSVLHLLAAWVGVALARAALGWFGQRSADRAVRTIRHDLRMRLLQTLFAHGPRWLRAQRSGELAELAGTHVEAIGKYFSGFAITRGEVVIAPLLLFAAALYVDRVVAAILLCTLPLIPLFMALAGWGAEAASRHQLQAITRMGGHFADRLRGLGLIRLYGRGDAEIAGVRAAAEGLRERTMKVLRIAFLSSATLEFFASLSVAMVAVYLGLTYLGLLHLRGSELTLGAGVFCLLLAPEFYAPLRRLAAQYHDRAAALAALDEIESSCRQKPVSSALHSGVAKSTAKSLDAGFRRHDEAGSSVVAAKAAPAMQLRRGDRIAIVGASGVGKTTLLESLLGWLPHDGLPIGFDAHLRIAYAPQRPRLFHGTIADNLRLAKPDARDPQLHAAARIAQVLRFAERLPAGLDTPVGENGFGLSGGEARRVALARTLLLDADVLLLDEPTAFLDAQTETDLLAALEPIARERIVIVATHSPAVMRWCGCVLHLPEGLLENLHAEVSR